MRKISLLGSFALLLLTLSLQERAHSWINFKFGAGINWNYQSGGNNTLWGFFRNGQPPGFGGCDPSCTPTGGCGPFVCQPQMPCMPPPCIPGGPCMPGPGMPPPFGPQGSVVPQYGVPPFGGGHYYPHEFQFFGNVNASDPNAPKQNSAAYGYIQGNQYTYYPYNSASSSYYGNNTSAYPSTSTSCYRSGSGSYPAYNSSYYGNGYYPNNSSSYYGNASGSYQPWTSSGYYAPRAWSNYYQSNPYAYQYNSCAYGR